MANTPSVSRRLARGSLHRLVRCFCVVLAVPLPYEIVVSANLRLKRWCRHAVVERKDHVASVAVAWNYGKGGFTYRHPILNDVKPTGGNVFLSLRSTGALCGGNSLRTSLIRRVVIEGKSGLHVRASRSYDAADDRGEGKYAR
jgi:hypothetical protein